MRWNPAAGAVVVLAAALAPSRDAVAQRDVPNYTIQRALSEKRIVLQAHGTGRTTGDAGRLTVSRGPRAPKGNFVVRVPVGSVLDYHGAAESLVVASVRGLLLDDRTLLPMPEIQVTDASRTWLVEAYSVDMWKSGATRSTRFAMDDPDPVLRKILQETRRRRFSTKVTQAAVWIYSDQLSPADARETLDLVPARWKAAKSAVDRALIRRR